MFGDDFVRDGCPRQRDASHTLFRAIRTLADRLRHATRLPDANTHAALIIADDHHCAESKAATPFDDFRHAGDVDDALVKFFAVIIALAARITTLTTFRH